MEDDQKQKEESLTNRADLDQLSDQALLRQFVKHRSEAAFAQIMRRHHSLVYLTCQREVADPELAKDVAQVVFLILARRAPTLRGGTGLAGWLFQTACFASKNAIRQERRRQRREKQGQDVHQSEQAAGNHDPVFVWETVEPHLNDVLARLKPEDREAILLRFFEGCSLAEVGTRLEVSENAARMRVTRALDKMRRHLSREGVIVTVAVLGAVLTDKATAGPSSFVPPSFGHLHPSYGDSTLRLEQASIRVQQLMQGVITAMRIKMAATLMVTIAIVSAITVPLIAASIPKKGVPTKAVQASLSLTARPLKQKVTPPLPFVSRPGADNNNPVIRSLEARDRMMSQGTIVFEKTELINTPVSVTPLSQQLEQEKRRFLASDTRTGIERQKALDADLQQVRQRDADLRKSLRDTAQAHTETQILRYAKDSRYIRERPGAANGTSTIKTDIYDGQDNILVGMDNGVTYVTLKSGKPVELDNANRMTCAYPGLSLVLGGSLSMLKDVTVRNGRDVIVAGTASDGSLISAVLDAKHAYVAKQITRFSSPGKRIGLITLGPPIRFGTIWLPSSAVYQAWIPDGKMVENTRYHLLSANFSPVSSDVFTFHFQPQQVIQDTRLGGMVVYTIEGTSEVSKAALLSMTRQQLHAE